MNCPTRDPDPAGPLGHNQSPSRFDNDLVTNSSMKKSAVPSSRGRENSAGPSSGGSTDDEDYDSIERRRNSIPLKRTSQSSLRSHDSDLGGDDDNNSIGDDDRMPFFGGHSQLRNDSLLKSQSWKQRIDDWYAASRRVLAKYVQFIGPGIMVSVAYMDPGNYSTAVSAGAMYKYHMLFVILLSNLLAVFLQSLCLKLGSVTGLDLAQNCRKHLPRWMCITVYILAEIAIIATDLAEVVGTAISLNILFGVPLSVGVALTVIDVLLVLMAYRPNGPMRIVRYFEYMVSALVFVVVICFAIELSKIGISDVGEVFKGFLPSKELVESQGLYLSCGILGATVMPHSLYLGSGLVQPRLREYDTKHGYYDPADAEQDSDEEPSYRPSIHAINYAMSYSMAELIISLFTVAIFVNSAILIVAGATLSDSPDEATDADLFSIYEMLKSILGPAAGTVFALALLFSGQSAGIVCTLAGQMVSEGFLRWSFRPYIRRLITRALAIAPCFAVSMFVGRKGLADVLNASQVVLSILLPVVSAPLLYFTCSKDIMKVPLIAESHQFSSVASDHSNSGYSQLSHSDFDEEFDRDDDAPQYKDMSNGLFTNILAVVTFTFVSGLNIFLIISMALGADVHL
uniref:ARAD1C27698p n=1 Tax=Blastobotrys adeninivorans TaxID=409370 RepID=A0A060T1Y2_BLAAD